MSPLPSSLSAHRRSLRPGQFQNPPQGQERKAHSLEAGFVGFLRGSPWTFWTSLSSPMRIRPWAFYSPYLAPNTSEEAYL